ncbi:MAG: hypothetical protein QOD72_2143, partial [Acidimicrobiaceae bacterium]|nr:hypothetical protein [Acidimicrobiaceae bacterium]
MDGRIRYDRALLLGGAKRGQVLDLWEVQRYGVDSYSDADYVSVYGMAPSQWYRRGVRLLGRTVVECTRDVLADAIGRDVAAVAQPALGSAGVLVVDPFVGSGNTLFWLVRHLPDARGLGFEVDDDVFFLTGRNFSFLDVSIELRHGDSVTGLTGEVVKGDE